MSKSLASILILIMAFSALNLLMVKPAFAQSIPKPSVPVINVQFVNHSYYVPSKTTTSTNPYTGEQVVTTSEGYYIQNDSFVITLTGQPLPNYPEVNGNVSSLYFVIASKGHYESQWQNKSSYYAAGAQGLLEADNNGQSKSVWLLSGDNATYQTDYNGYIYAGFDGVVGGQYGGQVDFRAMAVIGYVFIVQDAPNIFNIRHPYHDEFVALQSSDWSNTKTMTIPDGKVTTSTSPSPTPTVPEFPTAIISMVLLLATTATILFYSKNRKK